MSDQAENPNKKHFLVISIMIVVTMIVIGTLWAGLHMNPKSVPDSASGHKARYFEVDWVQGQEHLKSPNAKLSLNDFKGHPLILNFWASWCVSCKQEARLIESYWQKLKGTDVRLAGIAIQDTVESAKKFADFFGKTYILGLDTDGKASIDYGVTGVPETFFIDTKGTIRHKEAGPLTPELIERMLPIIRQ